MSSRLFTTALCKPRVSVVIPVRNGKDYLQEALDSVLQQSFTDLELLLINDGSTDDDYDRYALQDERIRVIHLTGTGVSRARNVGMAQSRGELIAFLDADDVWFPGKLEAQVRYFDAHPDVGVVFGKFIRWPALPGGGFAPANSLIQDVAPLTKTEEERSGWLYTRLLDGLLVGMNTAVVRRSVETRDSMPRVAGPCGPDSSMERRASWSAWVSHPPQRPRLRFWLASSNDRVRHQSAIRSRASACRPDCSRAPARAIAP